MSSSGEKNHLFDNPQNVKRLMNGLYVCCGILLILDFIISRYSKHPLEWIWGFYPIYGFVGCVILVIVAKWMRKLIMRDENYYGDLNKKIEKTTPEENL
ncbi:MAG: hypothetical protein HWE27_11370 [Gammaproteobacteria bacterium]|nr:hypothetical protein [Gammaproteobacteria bacterium]